MIITILYSIWDYIYEYTLWEYTDVYSYNYNTRTFSNLLIIIVICFNLIYYYLIYISYWYIKNTYILRKTKTLPNIPNSSIIIFS